VNEPGTEEMKVHEPGGTGWKDFAWLAGIVGTLWLSSLVLIGWWFDGTGARGDAEWAKRGQFGDLFGAVNALFSGLAFAGFIVALNMQRQELRDQRVATREQSAELKRSTEQSEQANRLKIYELLAAYGEPEFHLSINGGRLQVQNAGGPAYDCTWIAESFDKEGKRVGRLGDQEDCCDKRKPKVDLGHCPPDGRAVFYVAIARLFSSESWTVFDVLVVDGKVVSGERRTVKADSSANAVEMARRVGPVVTGAAHIVIAPPQGSAQGVVGNPPV